MDETRAQELLQAERGRLQQLLQDWGQNAQADRVAEDESARFSDGAEPLTAEATDDAIVTGIRGRLAAIDRAEQRLAAGTFGRSVRSGAPIPDERLEADPAAELTVQEAEQAPDG
jgi:DnaK suppressor protein